jgi:replicative DNA helicase
MFSSEISKALKLLSKELDINIVLLSQLSKAPELSSDIAGP